MTKNLRERIVKLKELEKEATPGPWTQGQGDVANAPACAVTVENGYVLSPTDDHDADLITYLRNNTIEMIEELEEQAKYYPRVAGENIRLQEEIEKLKEQILQMMGITEADTYRFR